MRVAVVEFAGRGGLIHYAFQLCRAMAREGADVTLLTDTHYELDALEHPFRLLKLFRLWDPKPAVRSSRAWSKARRGVRALHYYREWLRLLGHLRRERYDVVQFGDLRFATDFFPLRQARRHAPLLAEVCHNVDRFARGGSFDVSKSAEGLYRRSYELFDVVFVHYDRNRETFAARFPRIAERARTIVHGNEEIFRELRDPAVTPQKLRLELKIAPDEDVILFFGTLSGYKGIDLLIEAFRLIAPRYPRARLVVAGYPLPDFNLDQVVGERIHLVPLYIDSGEVAAWMDLASVVVFPYRAIFQSGALQIAMTFGTPTIATRVGANPEVLEDEVTGLLVPANDVPALAAAIERLLSNRDLARRLGEAARHAADQRFAWRDVARDILAAYARRG